MSGFELWMLTWLDRIGKKMDGQLTVLPQVHK